MSSKIHSEGFDRISFEKDTGVGTKAGVTATTTALLDQDDSRDADESGACKPDRNLTAAIWTIVCGVGLPCIPVLVISAVLVWIVLSKRVHINTGLPELGLPTTDTEHHGFTQTLKFIRHNAGPAYFVKENPSTITTIASWTSRVIPYLTSSIMALVAFFAARRIVTKSNKGGGDDLPTPEQLTLLIDLLGGKGLEPLKDTLLHRWVHKRKLVDPIPLAFGSLFAITMLGLIIPLVDTWFGIATTPVTITQLELLDMANPGVLGDATFQSSRSLSKTLCPNGPGAYSGLEGAIWASCNLVTDGVRGTSMSASLAGSDDAIRVLEGAPSALHNISTWPMNHTTGSGEEAYYYLASPLTAGDAEKLDFKATTYAIRTQCVPITQQCLPGRQWPFAMSDDDLYNQFTCTPGFSANFTFDGGSQQLDADVEDGGNNVVSAQPVAGLAFALDAELSERIGQFDPNLEEKTMNGSTQSVVPGTNMSYQYLQPNNPLHFAAWAQGFPSFGGSDQVEGDVALSNPLLNDSQIWRSQSGTTEWILNCSTEVYDVTYTWVNGSVRDFHKTLSSPEMGALISAPFAIGGLRERYTALESAAAAAGASDNSRDLADIFADRWSHATLALSAGVMSPQPNLLAQVRSKEGPVARVPLIPFYILLALKAIYVIAVIALAIGAYCFTHPAETEIVKTQLSTRGLAAAHFDTPDILQTKVVSQLIERLQPTTTKADDAEPDDPAKGGLKRAATFLGDIPDKRIGVVAQADGAWRFAVVANGVWNGIKPLAVDLVGIEAKAGNMGDAGDLVKAWMK